MFEHISTIVTESPMPNGVVIEEEGSKQWACAEHETQHGVFLRSPFENSLILPFSQAIWPFTTCSRPNGGIDAAVTALMLL